MLAIITGQFKRYANVYVWKPIRRYIAPAVAKLMASLLSPWRLIGGNSAPTTTKQQQQHRRPAPDHFTMTSIGKIKSVFREKFGTPRQGSMVPDGRGCLVIDKRAVDPAQSLESLDQFTHVWLVFVFHHSAPAALSASSSTASAKVRPPNFGGNKVGVFATRSPHRPSPIGLSLAKISRVDLKTGTVHLTGLDLCDGTPVLDIKPYNENVDWPGVGQSSAPAWLANPKFDLAPVHFTPEAEAELELLVCQQSALTWYGKHELAVVRRAIEQVIALDPRDLSRGRGTFSTSNSTTEAEPPAIPVDNTSFTRREAKIRDAAAVRPIYIRFDELNITFVPNNEDDDEGRGFLVVKVERFRKALKSRPSAVAAVA